MYRSRPVSLAPVGLFLWVTGCATYTQIELSDISNHDVVRVTTRIASSFTPASEGQM